jgi:O-acetyl-ADP-ribose deacetylase (regulator of RNase III)
VQQDRVIGQTRVQVLSGDVRSEPSDALITAINSGKMWFGGIDGAIQSAAGNRFHAQAAQQELSDLVTVVAKGDGIENRGAFKNVVFVVDDLRSPLRKVIRAGLEAADKAGFQTVTIPGIRLGVMLGQIEKSLDEAYNELDAGVAEFLVGRVTSISNIKFVLRD